MHSAAAPSGRTALLYLRRGAFCSYSRDDMATAVAVIIA